MFQNKIKPTNLVGIAMLEKTYIIISNFIGE